MFNSSQSLDITREPKTIGWILDAGCWNYKLRIMGKGSKERDIPIDESFGPLLFSYLADNKDVIYLFEGMTPGKPYAKRTIQKIYENVCNKAQINRKGGIHSLRHSYATHLLEQGVDINKLVCNCRRVKTINKNNDT